VTIELAVLSIIVAVALGSHRRISAVRQTPPSICAAACSAGRLSMPLLARMVIILAWRCGSVDPPLTYCGRRRR